MVASPMHTWQAEGHRPCSARSTSLSISACSLKPACQYPACHMQLPAASPPGQCAASADLHSLHKRCLSTITPACWSTSEGDLTSWPLSHRPASIAVATAITINMGLAWHSTSGLRRRGASAAAHHASGQHGPGDDAALAQQSGVPHALWLPEAHPPQPKQVRPPLASCPVLAACQHRQHEQAGTSRKRCSAGRGSCSDHPLPACLSSSRRQDSSLCAQSSCQTAPQCDVTRRQHGAGLLWTLQTAGSLQTRL